MGTAKKKKKKFILINTNCNMISPVNSSLKVNN